MDNIGSIGLHSPLQFHVIHPFLTGGESTNEKSGNASSRSCSRDAKAMVATTADMKDLPNSFVFTLDMPGMKSGDINVQVEDGKVLLISGERKREEEKEGMKLVRNERRMGKFARKFVLPENADVEKTAVVCQDEELMVMVGKLPPPEPRKPKIIEFKIA